MATLGDFEGAMNALRAEISGIVAPQIAASITGLRTEVGVSVTAALSELRQHGETTAQQVSVAVDERFQHASTGFSEEQDRLNGIIHAEQERLTKTQTGIEQMLEKLKTDVNTAVEKMAAVGDGELDDIATALIEQQATMDAYKADQAKNIDVIHNVMRNEVSQMHGDVTVLNTTLQGRMAAVEHVFQQQMMNTTVGDSREAPGELEDIKSVFPIQNRGT